ncbi:hypothetical protein C0J45_8591 [Silurus meridionalis]|nr:hypothetical protein C0J45_8591 [Silurus meridionalis]
MPGMVNLIAAVLVAHIMSVSCSEETINPDVVKAANFAIEFHNRMTNYPYAYKVVDILSNSVQMMICIFDVLAVPGENVVPEYVLLQHCV